MKSESVYHQVQNDTLKNAVTEITPKASFTKAKDLVIYELDEKEGTIKRLETYKGIPSDENQLNLELGEFNELYTQLLSLQQI